MFSLNSINTQNQVSHNRTFIPNKTSGTPKILNLSVMYITLLSLQIFVSVSQLSLRYSSVLKLRKHSNGKSKNVKRKETPASLYDATICPESLTESLRNFNQNALTEMQRIDVRSLSKVAGTSRKVLRSLTDRASVKKVSYVSSESFELNKNGWSPVPTVTVDLGAKRTRLSLTDNFVGLLVNGIRDNRFSYAVQVRGFKTERGIHADLKRNPNLLNRLRKFLGQYYLD